MQDCWELLRSVVYLWQGREQEGEQHYCDQLLLVQAASTMAVRVFFVVEVGEYHHLKCARKRAVVRQWGVAMLLLEAQKELGRDFLAKVMVVLVLENGRHLTK